MILFDGVTKRYGKRTILTPTHLLINKGEFVSIVGDSGVGKTTILKMLLGIEQPTEGRIFVDDENIVTLTPRELQAYRRTIGCIFQDYKLLPDKSVFDNVAFALEASDFRLSEILSLVPQALRAVGVHHLEHHYPHEISGGEAQRVALARAIVHKPKLILADEPTGNLDIANAKEVLKQLVKINMEGVTVILTTHNRPLVDLVGQRVVHIENGLLR